jgi:hypothetical protein
MNLAAFVVRKFERIRAKRLDARLYDAENRASIDFLRQHLPFAAELEPGLAPPGQKTNYWSLSPSSLRYFVQALYDEGRRDAAVVEFGGGRSTLIWDGLIRSGVLGRNGLSLRVTTYEHDPHWAADLGPQLGAVSLRACGFKQLADTEFERVFREPAAWPGLGRAVGGAEAADRRLRNCFYELDPSAFAAASLDGLILDGPHGNGRALAFPLLAHALKPGAVVLLDDFDHYPFIEQARRVLDVRVLRECETKLKRWALLSVRPRGG